MCVGNQILSDKVAIRLNTRFNEAQAMERRQSRTEGQAPKIIKVENGGKIKEG